MPKHRTDTNQAEIVQMLRDIGASVQDLSKVGGGCPDLLVSFRGVNYLFEVKNAETRGKLKDNQVEWHDNWRGPVAVVREPEDALREIGAME